MYHRTLANGFFIFGMVAVFLAAYGWSVLDIWLASTQWILISIVSLLVAIYVRMSAEDDEAIMQERVKTKKRRKPAKRRKRIKHTTFKLSDE